MTVASLPRPFETDRRLRLGVWGLGRGLTVAGTAAAVHLDLVAGCDTDPRLRDAFAKKHPEAWVGDDPEAFLRQDIDAVLVATFCPDHAAHAILALQAGKHVLSEVMPFHTPAEGVALLEAVETSGKVYQLAENYPYSPAMRTLAEHWGAGTFGDLMYAECSYVHDCLALAYRYGDGQPVEPGSSVHGWRSWYPWHYYNSHALGPVLALGDARPESVTALPGDIALPGHLLPPPDGLSGVAPSLIRLSNGALVRTLMGGTTDDRDIQRFWGTRAAATVENGTLRVRLGGHGHGPVSGLAPRPHNLNDLARGSGHGDGDFWVLYHFAREILEGVPGPCGIWRTIDLTLPGILAYRSATAGGAAHTVPDWRAPGVREAWRADTDQPNRPDPTTLAIPASSRARLEADRFSPTLSALLPIHRAWQTIQTAQALLPGLTDPEGALQAVDRLHRHRTRNAETLATASRLRDSLPACPGRKALDELLPEPFLSDLAVPETAHSILASHRRVLVAALPDWTMEDGAVPPGLPQLVMTRDLSRPLPAVELPAGYRLRPSRGAADADAWCAVMSEAFGHPFDRATFERTILGHEGYAPDRLWILETDPKAEVVGAAAGFGTEDEGYLHWVGIRKGHTGKRLGYWVNLQVLHDLRHRGVPEVLLQTDDPRIPAIRTYRRLGFRPRIDHRSHPARWRKLQASLA
ncbi:MAG: GNAT family N-acetyltransferase [Opitutales bacterium]